MSERRSVTGSSCGGIERGHYTLAIACVGLGDKEQAFYWLEKAYQHRGEDIILLKVDPRLDKLRSHLHFQDLMRRLGLLPG